jgi:hypothetical protein
MAFFAVDRFEGRFVMLIADDGSAYEVPRAKLPKSLVEGSVVVVDLAEDGRPRWSEAKLDAVEMRRRVEHALAQLEQLRRTDPGGDVTL